MDRRSHRNPAAWLALAFLAGCAPAVATRVAPAPVATTAPTADSAHRATDANGDGRVVVACLGDSNTDPAFNGRLPGGSWCERLASRRPPDTEFKNFGAGGGTLACDFPLRVSLAAEQLDEAILADADAIVLAFVTNDARYAIGGGCPSLDPGDRGRPISPQEIGREATRRLDDLVERARRPRFWVLLAPPVLPPEGSAVNETIAAINRALDRGDATSPRVGVIAHPALGPGDYADALHMSASGQEKRARAVGAELFGW
jgi:hypothetical protein